MSDKIWEAFWVSSVYSLEHFGILQQPQHVWTNILEKQHSTEWQSRLHRMIQLEAEEKGQRRGSYLLTVITLAEAVVALLQLSIAETPQSACTTEHKNYWEIFVQQPICLFLCYNFCGFSLLQIIYLGWLQLTSGRNEVNLQILVNQQNAIDAEQELSNVNSEEMRYLCLTGLWGVVQPWPEAHTFKTLIDVTSFWIFHNSVTRSETPRSFNLNKWSSLTCVVEMFKKLTFLLSS